MRWQQRMHVWGNGLAYIIKTELFWCAFHAFLHNWCVRLSSSSLLRNTSLKHIRGKTKHETYFILWQDDSCCNSSHANVLTWYQNLRKNKKLQSRTRWLIHSTNGIKQPLSRQKYIQVVLQNALSLMWK